MISFPCKSNAGLVTGIILGRTLKKCNSCCETCEECRCQPCDCSVYKKKLQICEHKNKLNCRNCVCDCDLDGKCLCNCD